MNRILIATTALASLGLASCLTTPQNDQYGGYGGGTGYQDPYNPAYGNQGANPAVPGQPAGGGYYGGGGTTYPPQPGYPAGGGYPQDGGSVQPVTGDYNAPPSGSGTSSGGGSPRTSSTHVVAKGDTLWGISRRYGASVNAIKDANGIPRSSDRILPGQSLRIP